jgi:hypothetical protein
MSNFHSLFGCLLLHTGFALAATVTPLPSTTHWIANTSGLPPTHIQNFIEHMNVDPDGKVLTSSFYDEGGNPGGVYKDGALWWRWYNNRTIRSDSLVTRNGSTWIIRNFYGRAFLGRTGPGPTGRSGPMIVSSKGDTIFSDSALAAAKYGNVVGNPGELPWIVDPTAIAETNDGKLMVASNGPDQNVRVVHVPPGGALRMDTILSLGAKGGVFAGPVPGLAGDRRFWGIRGLGTDSVGRIYVGNTGMPMQVGGGTDIRCFDRLDSATPAGLDTGRMLWKVQGLAFVNTADFDPDSNGTSVFKNAERFHMDWSKGPGRSWSLAAVTIDPFKYPHDPRLSESLEEVWVRRIGGKLFLFLNDMVGSGFYVIRFEQGSEIGIPVGRFGMCFDALDDSITRGIAPTWDPEVGDNWKLRWMWVDRNGDGFYQKEEFSTFKLDCGCPSATSVSDGGDILYGCGDVGRIPSNGLDANGIPGWDASKITKVPASELFPVDTTFPPDVRLGAGYLLNGSEYRMHYISKSDAMLVTSGRKSTFFDVVARWDDWSKPSRKLSWVVPVDCKWPSDGKDVSLDVNSWDAISPVSITADTQYMYVTYMDKGPDTVVVDMILDPTQSIWGRNRTALRGEITVWDMKHLTPFYDSTTKKSWPRPTRVGTIIPDGSVGHRAGATDLWYALNVAVQSDGTRLISAEEDGWGKVLIHRWCPAGEACSESVGTRPGIRPKPSLEVVSRGRELRILGDIAPRSSILVTDLRGRRITSWSNGSEPTITLPATGLYVLEVRQAGQFSESRKVLAR